MLAPRVQRGVCRGACAEGRLLRGVALPLLSRRAGCKCERKVLTASALGGLEMPQAASNLLGPHMLQRVGSTPSERSISVSWTVGTRATAVLAPEDIDGSGAVYEVGVLLLPRAGSEPKSEVYTWHRVPTPPAATVAVASPTTVSVASATASVRTQPIRSHNVTAGLRPGSLYAVVVRDGSGR
jgi:hypothetical protein